LKLNHTVAALTQIQAKVVQVRNDRRPRPKRLSSSWKRQTRSLYVLGFSSADLDQNQITDYLTWSFSRS
jgi:hypothetical protein